MTSCGYYLEGDRSGLPVEVINKEQEMEYGAQITVAEESDIKMFMGLEEWWGVLKG